MKRKQPGKPVALKLSPKEARVLKGLSERLKRQGVSILPRKVLLTLLEAAVSADEAGILNLGTKDSKGGGA